MTVAIETRSLTKRFGGLVAVDKVDLRADAGETLGIIGVNGAGKTTLMNCICGLYRPDDGDVFVAGDRVTGRAPHVIAHHGIGRTFQVPRVFRKMSLIDNLLVPVLDRKASDAELIGRAEAMLERM
ncbi:MAG: ATP-binding cassette domain-containing protein, partial [Burkholderiales bacterium]